MACMALLIFTGNTLNRFCSREWNFVYAKQEEEVYKCAIASLTVALDFVYMFLMCFFFSAHMSLGVDVNL